MLKVTTRRRVQCEAKARANSSNSRPCQVHCRFLQLRCAVTTDNSPYRTLPSSSPPALSHNSHNSRCYSHYSRLSSSTPSRFSVVSENHRGALHLLSVPTMLLTRILSPLSSSPPVQDLLQRQRVRRCSAETAKCSLQDPNCKWSISRYVLLMQSRPIRVRVVLSMP